jgi:hypothetical protein
VAAASEYSIPYVETPEFITLAEVAAVIMMLHRFKEVMAEEVMAVMLGL